MGLTRTSGPTLADPAATMPAPVRKVGFLPRYDDGNGWYKILPSPPPARVLAGRQNAAWLVIGAGFSGLSAARRLAEHFPDQQIALIEADRVGRGASGRNAGFAIDLPFLQEVRGDLDRARRILKLHRAGVAELDRLVTTHGIACDWSHRGKYMVATGDYALGNLELTRAFLERLGEPSDVLDRDELQARLGTRFYKRALYSPGTHLMNPAALTRGLAASLPANVTLYENSPIVTTRWGDEIVVETAQGSLHARGAIVAANGFTEAFGLLQRRIFNIMSFASLTRPLSVREQEALGGERDWGVHPVGAAGATIRRTRDERIWLRTSFMYAPTIRCSAARLAKYRQHHIAAFKARFPALGEPDFQHSYGGGLCLSRNCEPVFAQSARNLFMVGCQNGIGIAKGTIHGRLIADWAAGHDSELLQHARAYGEPSQLPPEPFLGWGVSARFAWEGWKGRAE